MTETENRSEGPAAFRSGFISIVGKPNVGKSTLLNHLLGEKIAPVSKKPQTTREVIHGIRTDETSQIIFIDTPGMHKPKDALGELMVQEIKRTLGEADIIYFVVEPQPKDEESERFLGLLKDFRGSVFLLINKVDELEDKSRMLPVIDHYQRLFEFKEFVPISALRKIALDTLLEVTRKYLPVHPPYFPADMISDRPIRDIVKELIREKVVRFTGEEIPYVTAVSVEEMSERDDGLIEIHANIFVDKESQKGILIGKGGTKIKQIGQAARQDLERFLGGHVYLDLRVKVLPGWKNDPSRLKDFGYSS
ncbi:MAG TPA: GTPase Era [Candidatus Omnitrophota bacterium]|nr:GTPase Era [Candidatus Omnitrophota bacterium]